MRGEVGGWVWVGSSWGCLGGECGMRRVVYDGE